MHLPPSEHTGSPKRSLRAVPRNRAFPWPVRVLAITLILLMQGPALLVQEVAWARMLVRYTQERGLKRAVVETFDGQHPCELCAKASEIRKNEDKEDPAERQAATMRLAWAEMIPAVSLKLPSIPQRGLPVLASEWMIHASGRGADAPVPPPPEWS